MMLVNRRNDAIGLIGCRIPSAVMPSETAAVMLAAGEHPRLRRRTIVFQQGVDTRASAGMTVGVGSLHLSPSCLPKASIHGFGDAPW
jgi:hypothetical protein